MNPEHKLFAELGGWKEVNSCPNPTKCGPNCAGWIGELPSGEDVKHLPDFDTNLQACFDVLEYFAQTAYTLQRNHPDDIEEFGRYEVELFDLNASLGHGKTINEAIQQAVLTAARAVSPVPTVDQKTGKGL